MGFTKPKKALTWQTIIFQNDTFFFVLKKPVNSATHAYPASQVFIPEKGFYLAIPSDLCRNPPNLLHFFLFAWFVNPRSIGSNIKPGWFCLAYRLKDLFCCIWAVKDQEKNRCFQRMPRGKICRCYLGYFFRAHILFSRSFKHSATYHFCYFKTILLCHQDPFAMHDTQIC